MKNGWKRVPPRILAVLLVTGSLAACSHNPALEDADAAPRTFSEFDLQEARENRDRLRTLNQLKRTRKAAD